MIFRKATGVESSLGYPKYVQRPVRLGHPRRGVDIVATCRSNTYLRGQVAPTCDVFKVKRTRDTMSRTTLPSELLQKIFRHLLDSLAGSIKPEQPQALNVIIHNYLTQAAAISLVH